MDSIVQLVMWLVFLIVEASTVAMVSAWFAVGALAALAASLLGAGIPVQVAVFLVVSAGMLACLRPVVRKHLRPRMVKTNVDSVIGSRGYVTADIDNVSAVGSVKLGAMEWTARSTSGEKIPQGTMVEVEKIEGVKVFVRAVEVTADI